jgi:ubiquitin-protein ligase
MTDKVYRRIFNKDIKNYTKDNLEEMGIHIHFDEVDITNAKILIIGPEDTPYENGCYIFNVKFTSEYPFKPPIVKFCCESKVRIHPNMYVNGKVCLSILGTWTGPSWTSIMDINCIAKSIQSLMTKKAIQNEPGYLTEEGEPCIFYDRIIAYENMKTYILGQVDNAVKNKLSSFNNVIINHFKKNNQNVTNKIMEDESDNRKLHINVYQIYDYKDDYVKLLEHWKKICDMTNKIE